METADLTKLEDRIYQQYNRDGALETLMGIVLLYAGLTFSVPRQPGLIGILPILVLLIGRAWKRKITYPRLGYAEALEIRRRGRKRMVLLIALAALALGALMVMSIGLLQAGLRGRTPEELPFTRIFFGSFIAAVIAGAGVLHRSWYVCALAGLMFVLFLAADFLGLPVSWAFGIPGALALATGLLRLRWFLKENPKLEAPEAL